MHLPVIPLLNTCNYSAAPELKGRKIQGCNTWLELTFTSESLQGSLQEHSPCENPLPQCYAHTNAPHRNLPHLNLLPSPCRSFSYFLGNLRCFLFNSRAVPSGHASPAQGMLFWEDSGGGISARCCCRSCSPVGGEQGRVVPIREQHTGAKGCASCEHQTAGGHLLQQCLGLDAANVLSLLQHS